MIVVGSVAMYSFIFEYERATATSTQRFKLTFPPNIIPRSTSRQERGVIKTLTGSGGLVNGYSFIDTVRTTSFLQLELQVDSTSTTPHRFHCQGWFQIQTRDKSVGFGRDASPYFLPATATTLTGEQLFDLQIVARGHPTPTITHTVASGSLPDGITIQNGRVYGIPLNVTSANSFRVVFTATNRAGSESLSVTFNVARKPAGAPVWFDSATYDFDVVTPRTQTVTLGSNYSPTATSFSIGEFGFNPPSTFNDILNNRFTVTMYSDTFYDYRIVRATNASGFADRRFRFRNAGTFLVSSSTRNLRIGAGRSGYIYEINTQDQEVFELHDFFAGDNEHVVGTGAQCLASYNDNVYTIYNSTDSLVVWDGRSIEIRDFQDELERIVTYWDEAQGIPFRGRTLTGTYGSLAFYDNELYSIDQSTNPRNLIKIDGTTGIPTVVGAMSTTLSFSNLASLGEWLWTISGTTLYRINPATAGVERVGAANALAGSGVRIFDALTSDGDNLFTIDHVDNIMYSIDSDDASLTQIANINSTTPVDTQSRTGATVWDGLTFNPVSYTHLTLPTICSV